MHEEIVFILKEEKGKSCSLVTKIRSRLSQQNPRPALILICSKWSGLASSSASWWNLQELWRNCYEWSWSCWQPLSSSGGERWPPAYLALRVCFLCLFGSGPIVTSPCLALLPHLPHVPDHPPVVSPSCRSHPPATELMLASVTLCQLNRNHAGQIEAVLRHFSLQWLVFFLGKMLNKLGLSLCQAQDWIFSQNVQDLIVLNLDQRSGF